MKILVRASNWIGDAVMTLPALTALARTWPRARIHVLAIPWVAAVHEGGPGIERVIEFDRGNKLRNWRARIGFLRSLAAENYDLGIVLPNSFSSALEMKLTACRKLLGVRGNGRDFLLQIRPERRRDPGRGHQIFDYFHLLAALGVDGGDPQPRIHLSAAEREDGRAELQALHGRRPVIALAPGAAYGSAKMWGTDRFAELAARLAADGYAVVSVGGLAEAAAAAQVAAAAGERGINLAGQLPLRRFFSLLLACQAFVCNDSGPMHVAAALDVPTVAIFGSTCPRATGPWSHRTRIVRRPPPCAPCLARTCPLGHRRCMEDVTVPMVRESLAELLAHSPAAPRSDTAIILP